MDPNIILDYLAGLDPRIAALAPSQARKRLEALRATGLALTVMEKAVQRHYERLLRPIGKRHQPWVDRVMTQLTAGLSALEAELPRSGWVNGELGLADITAACAFGFTHSLLADVMETSRYPNLAAFWTRAEALPAFRAAPAMDGATAFAIAIDETPGYRDESGRNAGRVKWLIKARQCASLSRPVRAARRLSKLNGARVRFRSRARS